MNKYYENRLHEINFHQPKRKGKKPKLYLVLDCETATLPFVNEMNLSANDKKKIAIAKPLIYDIGWQVIDAKGYVYSRHAFLVQETFFVPNVFNTAYYKEKRPLYMEKYKAGTISAKTWNEIINILESDLAQVNIVLAYNSMFDFKKAIQFSERYIDALYSPFYNEWEEGQKRICKNILNGKKWENPEEFDQYHFELRGKQYLLGDIWGDVCTQRINCDKYRKYCLENKQLTNSGLFFKSSAETVFSYMFKDDGFTESHTAIEDAIIESDILIKLLQKKKVTIGLTYFPFREIGNVYDYLTEKGLAYIQRKEEKEQNGEKYKTPFNVPAEYYYNALSTMLERVEQGEQLSTFAANLAEKTFNLRKLANELYNESIAQDELIKAIVMYNAFKVMQNNAKENSAKYYSAEYMANLFYSMIDEIKEERKKK